MIGGDIVDVAAGNGVACEVDCTLIVASVVLPHDMPGSNLQHLFRRRSEELRWMGCVVADGADSESCCMSARTYCVASEVAALDVDCRYLNDPTDLRRVGECKGRPAYHQEQHQQARRFEWHKQRLPDHQSALLIAQPEYCRRSKWLCEQHQLHQEQPKNAQKRAGGRCQKRSDALQTHPEFRECELPFAQ